MFTSCDLTTETKSKILIVTYWRYLFNVMIFCCKMSLALSSKIKTCCITILCILLRRILPSLVWHRQNWNVLRPYVHLGDVEIQDLKRTSHYVAGFTQPEIENRSGLLYLFRVLQENVHYYKSFKKISKVPGFSVNFCSFCLIFITRILVYCLESSRQI